MLGGYGTFWRAIGACLVATAPSGCTSSTNTDGSEEQQVVSGGPVGGQTPTGGGSGTPSAIGSPSASSGGTEAAPTTAASGGTGAGGASGTGSPSGSGGSVAVGTSGEGTGAGEAIGAGGTIGAGGSQSGGGGQSAGSGGDGGAAAGTGGDGGASVGTGGESTGSGGAGDGGTNAGTGGESAGGGGAGDGGTNAGTGGESAGSGGVGDDGTAGAAGAGGSTAECLPLLPAMGGDEYCSNTRGLLDSGYSYELWSQGQGSGCMTVPGVDANYSASWTQASDFLARAGLAFDSTQTHDEMGTITAQFAEAFTEVPVQGATSKIYVSLYGWTIDPLMEYYVIEDYGDFVPGPEASDGSPRTNYGTLEVDDGIYDIWALPVTNRPAITGDNMNFTQIFAVRRVRRNCGTISLSEHFAKWDEVGLTLGNLEEAMFLMEAQNNSGTIDVSATVTID